MFCSIKWFRIQQVQVIFCLNFIFCHKKKKKSIFHHMSPGNHFTVSWPELHWRLTWVNDASLVYYSRMQTHHLSHRVRGQRYMRATVTCLKVTPPDKSNLLHWHERLDWCVSHLLAMPRRRDGIDERASWWAVPTPYLSVCLVAQHLGIHLTDNMLKQTDLAVWMLPLFVLAKRRKVEYFTWISSVWVLVDHILNSSHLYKIGNRLWCGKQLVLNQKNCYW